MTMINNMPRYEQMKDSGVEWLGEIPEHWKIKRFKFLASVEKGRLPKKIVSNVDGDYPVYMSMEYLRGGDKTQWVLDKNVKTINEDEILLLWDGSNSGEFIKSREGVISSTVAHIQFLGLNKDFGWFFSFLIERQLRGNTIGMGIPHVDGFALTNSIVAIPPLPEQTAIANFLDQKTAQIDQAIALKQKQIELFKERKQLVIQQAVTKGLNPHAPMRDSGVEWIGEIPEHWEVKRVKNIFRLIIEPAPINNNHELLSVYTEIGVKPRKELEEKGNKASTTDGYWMVKKGDFIVNKLLAWMGAIGLSDYDGVTSPAYDILRPILDIDGRFFHLFFRTKFCTSELKKHSRGIMEMRLRLYFAEFGVIKIPFPSKDEQTAIVTHIETQSAKIDKAIDIQQQQINKLKEYKATLINSAVTGKIKVC